MIQYGGGVKQEDDMVKVYRAGEADYSHQLMGEGLEGGWTPPKWGEGEEMPEPV